MQASCSRSLLSVGSLLVWLITIGFAGLAHAGPNALDNDYPTCNSGEIYESAQPTNPGGVEPLGLCYSQCKGGYTGIGVRCYQNCEAGMKDLAFSCLRNTDIIAKDTFGRTAGTPLQCNPGQENIAGLCYDTCPSGYSNAGFFCAEKCKTSPPYIDTGLTCSYVYSKDTSVRPSTLPTGCGTGDEFDTGLCYPKCRAGYTGTLTSCYQTCPAGFIDTGLFCQTNTSILAKDIFTRSPGSCASIGRVQIGELCYPPCPAGTTSVGFDCHYPCPAGYTDDGLTCRLPLVVIDQDRYTRAFNATALDFPSFGCSGGKVKIGALCYPTCISGYNSVGLDCERPCPSGYTDDGLTCRRPLVVVGQRIESRAFDVVTRPYPACPSGYTEFGFDCHSVCPPGYTNDGLTCRKDAIIYSKELYDRGVGSLPSCSASTENILGVCYSNCPAGQDAKGAICVRPCPSGYRDDGLFCNGDYGKKTVSRTSLPGRCNAGEEQDGLLCYPVCREGYYGVGPVCWKSCGQGYHDDGAFCRRPEKIVFKDSYQRGAGRTPDTCDVASFDRSPPKVVNPVGPFTMIFSSDPQLLWITADNDKTPLANEANPLWCDGDCYGKRARETNRRQVISMNTIQFARSLADGTRGLWPKSTAAGKSAGRPIARPQGVVINGDLTAFWQHHDDATTDEVRLFRQYYEPAAHYAVREALQLPLFPGLGNHDYANNVGDCTGTIPHYSVNFGSNACAREAIDYMKTAVACDHVKNFPTGTVVSFDRDSLAYAFDIGKYRFVQMHNYPTYAKTEIGIKSSTTWLKKVLDDAKAKGKHAVLNYHDPNEHWNPTNADFKDALGGQDVVAIFAGHFHWIWGEYSSVTVDGKRIPVFLSGSSEYNRFLLAEFGDDYFTVGVINATTGAPVFDSGNLTSTTVP